MNVLDFYKSHKIYKNVDMYPIEYVSKVIKIPKETILDIARRNNGFYKPTNNEVITRECFEKIIMVKPFLEEENYGKI